ncbi:MAG: hypothetical protein CL587_02125 [Alteromonadaceae bacterium]|nr:hypothetical protein [Alteromonadaceae bacterium]
MSKLKIQIEVHDGEPQKLLEELALGKLGATRVFPVPGSDTLNIDGGLNDIRAVIDANNISFYVRYERDTGKFEKLITAFVEPYTERCHIVVDERKQDERI